MNVNICHMLSCSYHKTEDALTVQCDMESHNLDMSSLQYSAYRATVKVGSKTLYCIQSYFMQVGRLDNSHWYPAM